MAVETITIKKVSATDKKKDGSKLTGKYGDFWRVGIQAEEYGDEWINGFMSKAPTWQEGDKVDVEIGDEEYNGKTYKKFRLPKKGGNSDLEARVKKLEDKVFGDDGNDDDGEPDDFDDF